MNLDASLDARREAFDDFYNELLAELVDFVGRIGISPAHEVLTHADKFVPLVNNALRDMSISDEDDRVWLLTRVGYFVGEYFSQKFGGCWLVCEKKDSKFYARYVIGEFGGWVGSDVFLDPFEISAVYVDSPVPRDLVSLLEEAGSQLPRKGLESPISSNN